MSSGLTTRRVPARAQLHYSGDVNVEYGGMFYRLDTWIDGYVDVVRVVSCTDAGGPDNMWWVETLSVMVPTKFPFHGVGATVDERRAHRILHDIKEDHIRVEDALVACGWKVDALAQWDRLPVRDHKHSIVIACVDYGLYDSEASIMLRIGGPSEFFDGNHDEWQPTQQLRAGSSLRYFAHVA